jgi:ABC-type bacteriocin/lantibiotic exporter with double-glycine peptidase domain
MGLPKEQYWQLGSNCGPNALYCLLRAHGVHVNYEELLGFLAPPPEGNSLDELQRAAAHWGMPLKAFRTNRAAFERLKTPFIAHLENQGLRHFVFVTSHDRDGVHLWLPESGEEHFMRNEQFFRLWSGFTLTTGTRSDQGFLEGIVLVEGVMLASMGYWIFAGKATRTARRSPIDASAQ